MNRENSLARRLAAALVAQGGRLMPKGGSDWAEAMQAEVQHVAADRQALFFALGCFKVSVVERVKDPGTRNLFGRTFLPIVAAILAAKCFQIASRLPAAADLTVMAIIGFVYLCVALAIMRHGPRAVRWVVIGGATGVTLGLATINSIDALAQSALRHGSFYEALALEQYAMLGMLLIAAGILWPAEHRAGLSDG